MCYDRRRIQEAGKISSEVTLTDGKFKNKLNLTAVETMSQSEEIKWRCFNICAIFEFVIFTYEIL